MVGGFGLETVRRVGQKALERGAEKLTVRAGWGWRFGVEGVRV